ncbi:MAG TPA: adenylate/guanylate cyclase domain-containing protein [Candidatus Angelobacter sp.]|jgi:adenylate cyclase|nr:adenylate/guanylate cyclase domain-containing protein [Candidatus Angelobacter sp.]
MSRLIISSPDGKKGILELNKPVITIGRGNANDLVLNDSSVSRFHAVVKLRENAVVIADRGSTNGVVLGGKKIAQETEMQNGDIAVLGLYELRLEHVDEKGIFVRKAEFPSTINQIIRGGGGRPTAPPEIQDIDIKESSSGLADLVGRLKSLERENYLLTVLYDAGKALNSKLSMDDISEQVVSLALRIEGVERGFVMFFDESGEVSKQSEVRYRNPQSSTNQPIILSKSVLEMIRSEQQPILIDDISNDERFSGSESIKISGLRSAMCAPLVGTNQLFGILYVDNLERASAFSQEELNVFALVAAQAGAAIDNAMAHQKIAQGALQRSALERFLSPEVAEMVVANPDIRLGGVNQKVSVMFADIRGFTPMSEKMGPEQVVEILNEYFTRVTDVIFDYGGTLDKYLGDAVMAVFGAPISKGNDAAHCVNSAVQIQRLLIELNRDAAVRKWPELRVGIGINTGIVTAGNIGSPRRIDYTVIGDTVNTASRLMSNAAGGQILISQSTAEALGDSFDLERLPPLMVKGRVEPVQVFNVVWAEPSVIPTAKRDRSQSAGQS